MRETYTLFDGAKNAKGFAFVKDSKPALLTGIHILYGRTDVSHVLDTLVKIVCLNADREHRDIEVHPAAERFRDIDSDELVKVLCSYGFTHGNEAILTRKWRKL
jgi:hypothetical protein